MDNVNTNRRRYVSAASGGARNPKISFGGKLFAVMLGVSLSAMSFGAPAVANGNPACSTTSEEVVTGGVTYTVETISTAGTCTWSVPENVSSVSILLVAGGGGGGGGDSSANGRSGGGGGAGGQVGVDPSLSVDNGAEIVFEIGAGGVAGGAEADGSDGANSSYSISSPSAAGIVYGGGGGEGASGAAGNGGDHSIGLVGGTGSGVQGGSGASSDSSGSATTAVTVGRTYSGFTSVDTVLSNGGGGGNVYVGVAPNNGSYGSRGTEPGSGGGGGRGSQDIGIYTYGYGGSAGLDGVAMVRYVVNPVSTSVRDVPYLGPVSLAVEPSAVAGGEAQARGNNLDSITEVTVDGESVAFEVQGESLVFEVPDLASGTYTVEFFVQVNSVRLVSSVEITASQSSQSSEKAVNAGSFKGYVALYAKGYEGSRLSAKVGNDWVIVPVIPAAPNNLYRHVDFTGAGVDCAVRIYIDRVLMDTIYLTTK